MKYIYKILGIVILTAAISCGAVGCASEPVAAIINGEKISEPLYRIFLLSTQRGLEAIVPNIWEIDSIEGKSPEEIAKERASKSITYYVAVKQKADEVGVKLSKKQKSEIEEAAKKAMDANSEFYSQYGIKKSHFEEFLTYGQIEEQVVNELSKTYIPNEEELKTATKQLEEMGAYEPSAKISHIFFNNKDEQGNSLPSDKNSEVKSRAESVLELALNGEDINELAKTYSEDDAIDEDFGSVELRRGEVEETLQDVIFEKAQVGKVYPEIIETSLGYEIVKLEEIITVEDEAKAEMAKNKIQVEFINAELIELGESYKVEESEIYKDIHIMSMNDENLSED